MCKIITYMTRILTIIVPFLFFISCKPLKTAQNLSTSPTTAKTVLVIHGGAGTILKSQMTPEKEQAYKDALTGALQKGYAVLQNGGASIDAVVVAVKVLEDNPLFNAGKGSVFTNEGKK
jgi:beta-aspartyl-peptidase (threonine type)